MIEHIFIRTAPGLEQVACEEVELAADFGIWGDRYFGVRDEPGQAITFVSAEAIEAFAARHGVSLAPSVTGRNVVTRGVALNDLVGRTFTVGGLHFRGVELAEPCSKLGKALATDTLTPAEVVRQWLGHGGLRAEVLSNGTLRVGMVFDWNPDTDR